MLIQLSRISPGDTTGYLALDHSQKRILLVFRGTVSDENGETDLKFGQVDASDACTGCKAHEGFWGASNAAMKELQSSVESAAKENPDYAITLVGHSLGGALATLGAVSLRNAGHTVDMVGDIEADHRNARFSGRKLMSGTF